MSNPAPHRRFLLIGIGGVYNYGCEAIVRGTEILLHRRWPDAQVVYASPRADDDRQRLAGSNVEVIRREQFGRYSPRNVTRKLLSFAGVTWYPRMDRLRLADGADAVLSIGGDIYTLRPNGLYAKSLMKFGDAVTRAGKKYVLWSASVGPFTKAPKIERDVRAHLNRIGMIAARERETIDYLHSLGVRHNVVACADPAFLVAPELRHQPRGGGCPRIAVNLRPLLATHGQCSVQEMVRQYVDGIATLLAQVPCQIVLVPHVVSDFKESDDDLRCLVLIKESLPRSCRDRVDLLGAGLGFVGTKRELIRCDLVIAARMHCAINAIAANVPTLLLSYSRKALGMAQYVYGCKDWVVPLREFGQKKMIEGVSRMLEAKERIANQLRHRMGKIRVDAGAALRALERLLD